MSAGSTAGFLVIHDSSSGKPGDVSLRACRGCPAWSPEEAGLVFQTHISKAPDSCFPKLFKHLQLPRKFFCGTSIYPLTTRTAWLLALDKYLIREINQEAMRGFRSRGLGQGRFGPPVSNAWHRWGLTVMDGPSTQTTSRGRMESGFPPSQR